jgi:Uma2 family endonuclease
VREYWIVDPERRRTTVYRYEEDAAPVIYPFDVPVESGICPGFRVVVADLI